MFKKKKKRRSFVFLLSLVGWGCPEEQGDSKSTQLFLYLLYYHWVCEVSVSLQEETVVSEWNLHILNRAKIIHYLEKSGPCGHGPSLVLG